MFLLSLALSTFKKMHLKAAAQNHCAFNLVEWSTSSTAAHFAMATCTDLSVEKEIVATTTESSPISALATRMRLATRRLPLIRLVVFVSA